MLRVKRIVAITMAMIICVSFLLVGNTASAVQLTTPYYEDTKYFFGNEGSYAYAYMSNRGPNEEDTNLRASTYVKNTFWEDDPIWNTTEVKAYVYLDVRFDNWHPSPLTNTAIAGVDSAGNEAWVYGAVHDDFDHWVVGFSSTHILYKNVLEYDETTGRDYYTWYQWGNSKGHSWTATD